MIFISIFIVSELTVREYANIIYEHRSKFKMLKKHLQFTSLRRDVCLLLSMLGLKTNIRIEYVDWKFVFVKFLLQIYTNTKKNVELIFLYLHTYMALAFIKEIFQNNLGLADVFYAINITLTLFRQKLRHFRLLARLTLQPASSLCSFDGVLNYLQFEDSTRKIQFLDMVKKSGNLRAYVFIHVFDFLQVQEWGGVFNEKAVFRVSLPSPP